MSLLDRLPNRDDLLAQLRKASELAQSGQAEQALEAVRAVAAACAAAGVESPHVLWALAVTSDYAGNLRGALAAILKCLSLDPLMPPAEQSLWVIVNRCRKRLTDAHWDEEAARLYGDLADQGYSDDPCRVAYAAYLHEQGKHQEALRVAEAVALLNPRLPEAWRIVGAAAHALGNKDLAQEASLRCQAARSGDGWNQVPRGSWGAA